MDMHVAGNHQEDFMSLAINFGERERRSEAYSRLDLRLLMRAACGTKKLPVFWP